MKNAQDTLLKCDQTDSFSTIEFHTMPSEELVRVVKFHEKFEDSNVIRYKTTASHRSYTNIKSFIEAEGPSVAICGISSERPDATVHGNSSEATGCVMTKTTLRPLELISDFKEILIGRLTAKKENVR